MSKAELALQIVGAAHELVGGVGMSAD